MPQEDFPFVVIPPEMEKIIGIREGPARVWRKDGPEAGFLAWHEALTECVGTCISPGGVSMICPVSRPAVHHRVKDGKLSLFLYHSIEKSASLFRRDREVRTSPYGLVPVSECRAWKKEFENRAVRQELISREDLEGAKPDWEGEFLQWDSRWQLEQRQIGGPRDVTLNIKLSATEIENLQKYAENLGMKNADELGAMVLGDAIHGAFSGHSFMKIGMKMARMIEKSGKGVLEWKDLLKWS